MECKTCHKVLRDEWIHCPNCSTPKEKISTSVQCKRCYQMIFDQTPNFCPFCTYQLVKKPVIEGLEKADIKEISKFEEPERVVIVYHDNPIKRSDVVESLKYDSNSQLKIAGSRIMTHYVLLLFFIIGIADALSFLIINSTFGAGSFTEGTKVFVTVSIAYPVTLLMIAVFLRLIMNICGVDMKIDALNNIIASTAPIFVIKNVISILLSLYVYTFMSRSQGVALGIFFWLTGIVLLILLVQLLIFVKNTLGTSGFMSFILVGSAFTLAGEIGSYYVGMLIYRLLEVII